MSGGFWTDDKIEELKGLWADETPTVEIGAQLGCTKAAVCSKARRIGLPFRSPEVRAKNTRQGNIRLHGSANGRKKAERKAHPWAPEKTRAAPRRIVEQEAPGAFSLLTLPLHGCKWPIGDPKSDAFGFCGAPCAGGAPYCNDHVRIAYDPSAPSANELMRSLRRLVA